MFVHYDTDVSRRLLCNIVDLLSFVLQGDLGLTGLNGFPGEDGNEVSVRS